MATGLNYDKLKDRPIKEIYKQWARQYFTDPQDPSFALNMFLQDPAIQDATEQARAAQEAAQSAYRQTFAAQRAAAAKQRAISRKRMQFKLDTGLRDIEKGRQRGLEGVVNDALQRGIYRSGIRIENEETVNTDSDDAASDLRKQIDLALQGINASASAEGALARAQDAAFNAEDLQAYADALISGAYTNAQEHWSSPMEEPQTVSTPPGSAPTPPGGPATGQFKVPYAPEPEPPGSFYPQLPQPKQKPAVQPVGSPY